MNYKGSAIKAYMYAHNLPENDAVEGIELLLELAYINGQEEGVNKCEKSFKKIKEKLS